MPSPAPGERQMPQVKSPSVARESHMYKKKAAEMGESIQHRVEPKQDDTKSLASAKERMAGSANMALVATVTAVGSSQKVANMLLNNAMGSANDSFSVLETLGVNPKIGLTGSRKSYGARIEPLVCPRTQAFREQKDALELDPLVYDWDKTDAEVKKCLGMRTSYPIAFNTATGMRWGLGTSALGPLTPVRLSAIELAGRKSFGPQWKPNLDAGWIVAQRDQGHKNVPNALYQVEPGGKYILFKPEPLDRMSKTID